MGINIQHLITNSQQNLTTQPSGFPGDKKQVFVERISANNRINALFSAGCSDFVPGKVGLTPEPCEPLTAERWQQRLELLAGHPRWPAARRSIPTSTPKASLSLPDSATETSAKESARH